MEKERNEILWFPLFLIFNRIVVWLVRKGGCLVVEKLKNGRMRFSAESGRDGDEILSKIFKREWEQPIPPHLGFETGMENLFIFWEGNGIGVPRPKLALLLSLSNPSRPLIEGSDLPHSPSYSILTGFTLPQTHQESNSSFLLVYTG